MARNIQLQNTFSGPLDLLLYLVRRDEIDIHDIPIAHVTKEYLGEINRMDNIDVDAGGEFLAMASMLTEIKGRMLLPEIKTDDEDEDELYDPRQGLVEALLEYKKFKEVAAELEEMSANFDRRYARNVAIPQFEAVVHEKAEELGALDLLAAFQRIARRMLNEQAPREIVSEEVPTEVRIKQIEEVVRIRGRVSFTSILSDSPTEDEMVGFFIAMLELIRLREISAQQSVDFSEIYFVALDKEVISEVEKNESINNDESEEIIKETQVKGIGKGRRAAQRLSNPFGLFKRFDKVNNKDSADRKSVIDVSNIFGMKTEIVSEIVNPKYYKKSNAFMPLCKLKKYTAADFKLESMVVPNCQSYREGIISEVVGNKIAAVEKRVNKLFLLANPFVLSSKNSMNNSYNLHMNSNKFDVLGLRKEKKPKIVVSNNSKIPFGLFSLPYRGLVCSDSGVSEIIVESSYNVITDFGVRFSSSESSILHHKLLLANPFGFGVRKIVNNTVDLARAPDNKFDVLGLRRGAINDRISVVKKINNSGLFSQLKVSGMRRMNNTPNDDSGVAADYTLPAVIVEDGNNVTQVSTIKLSSIFKRAVIDIESSTMKNVTDNKYDFIAVKKDMAIVKQKFTAMTCKKRSFLGL